MTKIYDDRYNTKIIFEKNSITARETEKEIADMLLSHYGWKTIHFNDDNKYDLLVIKNKKKVKIEIKEDFTCERTGNVGLEFHSRGKPSGISTSEAHAYLFKVHTKDGGIVYLLTRTEVLKKMIENHEYHRVIVGGDKGSDSKNYLFKYGVLKNKSRILFI